MASPIAPMVQCRYAAAMAPPVRVTPLSVYSPALPWGGQAVPFPNLNGMGNTPKRARGENSPFNTQQRSIMDSV